MANADEIKLLLFSPIFAGGFLFAGFRMLRTARQIRDTPTSRIATAAQGQVEIQGFAWPAEDVIKRSNGQLCVHYWWSIERYEKQGKKSRWVTVFTEKSRALPFLIVDDSAAVFVDTQKSSINTASEAKNWNSLRDHEQKLFSSAVGSSVPGFPPLKGLFGLFMKSYRVSEYFVPIGSPLFAYGHFESPADYPLDVESPGLHHFVARVRRLKGRGDARKAILDSDGDGKVSHQEMTRGYHLAAVSSLAAKEQPSPPMTYKIQGKLTSSNEIKAKVHIGDQDHALRSLRFAWFLLAIGGIFCVFFILQLMALARGKGAPL